MSIEYMVGVAVGILVSVLVLWLILRKSRIKNPPQFDERQMIARARAYSVGFFTILFYCVLYAAVSAFGIVWCKDAVGMFIGCFVGITAFVLSAIRHDAYFGINEDVGTTMKLGAVVVIFCLIGGVMQIIDGEVIEDGLLTENVLPLVVAAMWVAIIIAQKLHVRRTSAEDSE